LSLLGILLGLGALVALAYRGWSVLLLAPLAALIAAAASGEPLLAHWTHTLMSGAADFLAQFFPLFLLGALFGKVMADSGSMEAIADFMTRRMGKGRAMLRPESIHNSSIASLRSRQALSTACRTMAQS
jgi:H+/gluconate symporter-like permease